MPPYSLLMGAALHALSTRCMKVSSESDEAAEMLRSFWLSKLRTLVTAEAARGCPMEADLVRASVGPSDAISRAARGSFSATSLLRILKGPEDAAGSAIWSYSMSSDFGVASLIFLLNPHLPADHMGPLLPWHELMLKPHQPAP